MSTRRGGHAARSAAAGVVVAAGITLASGMLAPFLLALFLAAVTAPMVFWLRHRRVPAGLAIALGILADMLLLGAVASVVAGSMTTFYQRLPEYQAKANLVLDRSVRFLQEHGLAATGTFDRVLHPARVMSLVVDLLGDLASMVSQSFVVLLTVGFLLIEITFIGPKLRAVMHDQQDLKVLATAAHEANTYLLVKTSVSLATGTLAGLACWLFGVDFPVLWGLLAYLLNYIPNIGSFVAAIPPILLGLLTEGGGQAVGLAGAYLAINVVVGNIVEPKLTGDALGLSALVVFLSVIVWGFLLGPIGALLSAPLTLVVKHWLAHTDDWAWMATMLEPSSFVARRTGVEGAMASAPEAAVRGDG